MRDYLVLVDVLDAALSEFGLAAHSLSLSRRLALRLLSLLSLSLFPLYSFIGPQLVGSMLSHYVAVPVGLRTDLYSVVAFENIS